MTKSHHGKGSEVPSTELPPPEDVTIESIHTLLKEKFDALEDKVATKECINNLRKIIDEQKSEIKSMKNRIEELERNLFRLQDANDEAEQYQRRLCLRLHGIDLPLHGHKETADDCLAKVKSVIDEIGVDLPDSVIDRAHRVGKVIKVNGKEVRQMIIRLTTWRHRTMIYKARKNNSRYKIKLDLTKRRRELLKKANEVLDKRNNSFAFADINCRICLFQNGDYHYFDNLNELDKLINEMRE